MKDFIREYGKVAGIFAAAAFVLSLFVGLFTGNPFGVLIVRAFLLAILFGALGLGFAFTVKKYLPELAGEERERAPSEAEPSEKHAVDIVLPEEAPLPRRPRAAEPEMDSDVEEEVEALGEESSPPEETVSEAEELTDETLTENAAYHEDDDGILDGEGEPVLGRTSKKRGVVEGLPEIDFAGPGGSAGMPASEGNRPNAGGKERSRARKSEDAAREFIGDEDPETLAKAIRTVMKRDERG